MKKNKGTTLFLIGIALSTLGMTILSDYKILQYTTMILGLLIMIYSVFLTDKWKKSQKKLKE
jgi:sulfite exporter TauE/SafE